MNTTRAAMLEKLERATAKRIKAMDRASAAMNALSDAEEAEQRAKTALAQNKGDCDEYEPH
jgi:hypothetical protein